MRSEFEKWFKTTKFYENMIKSITTHEIKAHPFDRTGGKYKSIYVQLAFESFKHQQSKVDELTKQRDSFIKAYEIEIDKSVELQKNNAWLSGVACRENKRANKLQEENVNTTVLLGKTIQEKNELQKRVDAAQKLIDDWNCGGVHIFDLLDGLEQALKGEQ